MSSFPTRTATVPTREEIEHLSRDFEHRSAQWVLEWAVQTYRPRLVVSCSFGGVTTMAIVDMVMQIDPAVPVAYLDTGLLFPETYELVATIADRYGIEPIAIRPAQSVAEQNAAHGEALWAREPQRCCTLRKVEPQRAFLHDYDAWVTGLRREQSPTRKETPIVGWDTTFNMVKISPLAAWDERAVWRYLQEHDVPYNPLLTRGYASIGCTHCTRPIVAGEEARAGRWSGTEKTECGLHVPTEPTR
ncbi:MAG TPA: phosphoadenylyl-sulfate reductase [Candidatus Acidoferrales bacterium]|nr:phosphoadenylyl-sulfate reductase [Candidatus Acidoferrales bacterium]